MKAFNVSSTVALLGLSIYNLGLACGPVIASPISETFGRLIVYRITLPAFALFTLGAGCSQNIASFITCRFFAGVFGAPALAVGAGTIADLFPPATRAVAMSIFIFAPFSGPTFGRTDLSPCFNCH
jgi:MFS family permease